MILQLTNIQKSYTNNSGKISRQVLSGVNLSVVKKDSLAIIGPSGSGKTTLLNIIGSLSEPDQGTVIYNNEDILKYTAKQKLQYRNQHLGFVFQNHYLLPQFNLLENIMIPTIPGKHNKSEAQKHARGLMEKLKLWELRNQKPGEVSVGECQRAAICRALINKPSMIIADEPSGSLDMENTRSLGKLLNEIKNDHGVTLIIVTHSLEFASMFNHLYTLKNGQLHKQDNSN